MKPVPLALLLLLGCGDDGMQSSPSTPSASAAAPQVDPCVEVRAEYFRREQRAILVGALAAGRGDDPFTRSSLARFKLDYPQCFF